MAACSAGPEAEGVPAQQAEGRMLTSAPISTRNFRPVVRSETKNRRLGDWPGVLVAISLGISRPCTGGGTLGSLLVEASVVPAQTCCLGVVLRGTAVPRTGTRSGTLSSGGGDTWREPM